MPTFQQVPSRAQRQLACDRIGHSDSNHLLYDVNRDAVQRRCTGLISFESSPPRDKHTAEISAHGAAPVTASLTSSTTLKRPLSATRSFDKMIPHGTDFPFDRNDLVKLTSGGTHQVLQEDIAVKFARPLSRGTGSCIFDKTVSREKRARVGAFADPIVFSKTTTPQRASLFTVVDPKVHGPAPWRCLPAAAVVKRPTSASSCSTCLPLVREDDPLRSFLSTKRPVARGGAFSKAPRKT